MTREIFCHFLIVKQNLIIKYNVKIDVKPEPILQDNADRFVLFPIEHDYMAIL